MEETLSLQPLCRKSYQAASSIANLALSVAAQLSIFLARSANADSPQHSALTGYCSRASLPSSLKEIAQGRRRQHHLAGFPLDAAVAVPAQDSTQRATEVRAHRRRFPSLQAAVEPKLPGRTEARWMRPVFFPQRVRQHT
ncbi:hypothetical protein PC116_g25718 [Phytophthora cactorum]|uniref:Uncharacterized protein n=1 Tax=Phytophthora cactorum TaxID=29920 RepID=A0A8T1JR86_9STRA|nr:hypothetical protein PC112_g21689 [Phytophthora cactorum]KAG2827351.1 hypothetical protein PC113_g21636 [Phytophthora cactorum]KAG2877051.1 hypothetical protein PC114_g23862 [Phytophthora cactorum]KAG2881801.1 hypothetical protein PC115_g22115 [Phytophthora cactorum]KAG2962526.1 hypothetical protein PC118_g21383 [Phytophthora cactorum]